MKILALCKAPLRQGRRKIPLLNKEGLGEVQLFIHFPSIFSINTSRMALAGAFFPVHISN
jgi:hypothetical protein